MHQQSNHFTDKALGNHLMRVSLTSQPIVSERWVKEYSHQDWDTISVEQLSQWSWYVSYHNKRNGSSENANIPS